MKIRYFTLLLGALLLTTAPAQAATLTYAGRAQARALNLTIADNALTIGATEAHVQSGPTDDGCEGAQVACAEAAAAVEPFGETATAHAPGNEGPTSTTAISIPDPLNQILSAEVAIAEAEASGAPDPSARGDAGVANLGVTLTQSLAENAPQVQEGLQQISDELAGPIADGDPSGEVGPRLKGALDHVIGNLDEAPIATIAVAPSGSDTQEVDGVVTARADAQGAVIVLSPTAASTATGPEGLVIVEVGAASASATTDGTDASAAFDPALVRLRVFDPVTQKYEEVEVAADDAPSCGGQAPLVACVGVGSGSTTEDGTSAAAVADGVTVTLFDDPLPQIVLELAHAEAGVNAQLPPSTPTVEQKTPELPRTGGGAALPAVAFLAAGGAGLAVVRRWRS